VHFLFLAGQTGVGKNPNWDQSCSRIPCSTDVETQWVVGSDMFGSYIGEKHAVARLIGCAFRGMSAMTKAVLLTEAVRRRPYQACACFDEGRKKRTPMCFNIIVAVLDDGVIDRRSGSQGRLQAER